VSDGVCSPSTKRAGGGAGSPPINPPLINYYICNKQIFNPENPGIWTGVIPGVWIEKKMVEIPGLSLAVNCA